MSVWDNISVPFAIVNIFIIFYHIANYTCRDRINKNIDKLSKALPGWVKTWGRVVGIIIQPIFAVPTLIFFNFYIIWAAIVLDEKLYEKSPDISGPVSILATTIAFTLPLLASAAVQRNKDSLFNYNAFCGDIIALGWETLSLVRDEQKNLDELKKDESKKDEPKKTNVSTRDQYKIHQIYQLLLILPTAVKWKFRNKNKFDIENIYMIKHAERKKKPEPKLKIQNPTKRRRVSVVTYKSVIRNNKQIIDDYVNVDGIDMGRPFVRTVIGEEYKNNFLAMNPKDADPYNGSVDQCDLIFVMLFDIISEFRVSDTRKNMLTRTAERVYGSYGNMGNIRDYKLPLMYEVFMGIALVIFLFAFPFSYSKTGEQLQNLDIVSVDDNNWDATAHYKPSVSAVTDHEEDIIWHGIIMIYFLFGMNLMTRRVSNAFVSQSEALGYNTVGESETNTNYTMHALYQRKFELQKNNLFIPTDLESLTSKRVPSKKVSSKNVDSELKSNGNRVLNRRKLYV
tara:strand:- start:9826 stop:11355 length:1530 start_codon:yes stop_codon:yes gene_type:complete